MATSRAAYPPEDALRTAQLSLLHSGYPYKKPYYWGPFQLYSRTENSALNGHACAFAEPRSVREPPACTRYAHAIDWSEKIL